MDMQHPLPSSRPHHPDAAKVDLGERAACAADSELVDLEPLRSHSSVHAPVPTRPSVPQCNSGTVVQPQEDASEPVETKIDARAMSPRRTSEDIETLGREIHTELSRHAKALQDSLHLILSRIDAVKAEHDKLDSNNKFLQKYIGDLMSTSKITVSGHCDKS